MHFLLTVFLFIHGGQQPIRHQQETDTLEHCLADAAEFLKAERPQGMDVDLMGAGCTIKFDKAGALN